MKEEGKEDSACMRVLPDRACVRRTEERCLLEKIGGMRVSISVVKVAGGDCRAIPGR